MASELAVRDATGSGVYFLIWSPAGQILDVADSVAATYVTANYAKYALAATETPAGSGIFVASFPAWAAAGRYSVEAFHRSDISPAASDARVGKGGIDWDGNRVAVPGVAVSVADKSGYGLAASGLDQIAASAPSHGSLGSWTFPQRLMWLTRRFLNRATRTTTAITLYADDAQTVLTTQAITDDGGGNETQGAAT